MEEFSRVADMKDNELVRWSFVFAHMRRVEKRLSSLGEGFVPSPELAASQDALKTEIDRRTKEKGEQP